MGKLVKYSLTIVLILLVVMFMLLNLGAITVYLPFQGPLNISLIVLLVVSFLVGGVSVFICAKLLYTSRERQRQRLKEEILKENGLWRKHSNNKYRNNNLRLKLKKQSAYQQAGE